MHVLLQLVGSRVVDRHKYCLLETQECFETYCMRKDQAESVSLLFYTVNVCSETA